MKVHQKRDIAKRRCLFFCPRARTTPAEQEGENEESKKRVSFVPEELCEKRKPREGA